VFALAEIESKPKWIARLSMSRSEIRATACSSNLLVHISTVHIPQSRRRNIVYNISRPSQVPFALSRQAAVSKIAGAALGVSFPSIIT
jgi:hypothetical protein